MIHRFARRNVLFAALLGVPSALGAFLMGCGGGTHASAGPATVLQVSAAGVVTVMGTPNAGATLPFTFRNQAVQLTFDGPLDDGILGGFQLGVFPTDIPVNLSPRVPAPPPPFAVFFTADGVPYFAYNDQLAARMALRVLVNAAGAPPVPCVLGRHRDHPSVLVLDPAATVVDGVPPPPQGAGWPSSVEIVLSIPTENPLRFRGQPAVAFGPDPAALPIMVPAGAPPAWLFFVHPNVFDDGAAPTVESVVRETPAGDGSLGLVRVNFSKPINVASALLGINLTVRTTAIVTTAAPLGVDVPGTLTPDTPGATLASALTFAPSVTYGPPPGGTPVTIVVDVGSPNLTAPQIVGAPAGFPTVMRPLSGTGSLTFTIDPCVGCAIAAAFTETFQTLAARDLTFVPAFGAVRWNDAAAPGQLTGRAITGGATGLGAGGLGTRTQVTVDPMPINTVPAGLFSPFDAGAASSGSLCGAQGCNLGNNPNGGSHIMHLYESVDLNATKESLELVEWSPVGGVVTATTYPQYQAWCGVTTRAAPLSGVPAVGGLLAVFQANYDLATYQPGSVIAVNQGGNGVVTRVPVNAPMPYVTSAALTAFFPYPVFSTPFDFARANGTAGAGTNLVFEQNIESGTQLPNFNLYRATAVSPVRRMIARPISMISPNSTQFADFGGFDVYRMRFTFVNRLSEGRTLWYDTGVADPVVSGGAVTLLPDPSSQPQGTRTTLILEGTDAPNPAPGTVPTVSVVVLDSAGILATQSTAMATGLRFVRFRFEITANPGTNTLPAYTGLSYAFGP